MSARTSIARLVVQIEKHRVHRGWTHWKLAREADLKLESVQRALGVGAAGAAGAGRVHLLTLSVILETLDLELHVKSAS